MCIICVSPAGVRQPDSRLLRSMFQSNPHGAGYMTARAGKVAIHKGFMQLPDLLQQLNREQFTADDVVIYHFRISTQAGTTASMTHPFPLTGSLDACSRLNLTCSCGVAHNGVIPMTSDRNSTYSDTALFITRYMHRIIRRMQDLQDPDLLRMVEELIQSRMAILDKTGEYSLLGSGWFENSDGLIFSNRSFLRVL